MLGGVPFNSGSRDLAQKTGFVKIADFGLSRSLAINKAHSKTDDAKAVEADRLVYATLTTAIAVRVLLGFSRHPGVTLWVG